jgi:IS5 family transposase
MGLPLDFLVTAGQVNDCTQAIALLGQHNAEAVLADKGYDSDAIVEHVERMGARDKGALLRLRSFFRQSNQTGTAHRRTRVAIIGWQKKAPTFRWPSSANRFTRASLSLWWEL